jgi:hypothetical protein
LVLWEKGGCDAVAKSVEAPEEERIVGQLREASEVVLLYPATLEDFERSVNMYLIESFIYRESYNP